MASILEILIIPMLINLAIGGLVTPALVKSQPARLSIFKGMIVKAQVGTPRQPVYLSIDTQLRMTWLLALRHSETNDRRFDTSKSLTFRQDDSRKWAYTYVGVSNSTSVRIMLTGCSLGSDDMELARMNVKHQNLGLIDESMSNLVWEDMGVYNFNNADGILGLGNLIRARNELIVFDDPVQNLFKQNLIDEQMFSIFIDKTDDLYEIDIESRPPRKSISDNQNRERIGTLYLGELSEHQLTGKQVIYVPIKSRWSFKLDSVQLMTSSGAVKTYSPLLMASIDTHSEIISGPQDEIAEIIKNYLVYSDKQKFVYTLESCEQVLHNLNEPDLVFNIGGERFKIPFKDLVMIGKKQDAQVCKLALRPNVYPDDSTWHLGLPFLRNYGTIFDYTNRKVGLVKSL